MVARSHPLIGKAAHIGGVTVRLSRAGVNLLVGWSRLDGGAWVRSVMGGPADEAFSDFVATHSASLMRLAYLLTGRRSDAEDAVQNSLLKVYMAWSRIERVEAIEAYARKTLVREVSTVRRGPLRRLFVTDRVPETAVVCEADAVETKDVVHAALLRLPARQRAVIVLRYFGDLTEQQTADVLGVRVGTVKQHAARGLARLRDELSNEAQELP